MEGIDPTDSCEHKVVVKILDVVEAYGCSSCGLSLEWQDWMAMNEPSNGLRKFAGGEPYHR